MKKNYIDEQGNYHNIQNLSLTQIYDSGVDEGYRIAKQETPKGKWLDIYESHIAYECSNCHRQMPVVDFNFCPNCGADMRGDTE